MKTIIKNLYDAVTKAHHTASDAMGTQYKLVNAMGAPKTADEAAVNARIKFDAYALVSAEFAKLYAAENALHKALGFEGADFTIVTPVDIDNAYAASQQGE